MEYDFNPYVIADNVFTDWEKGKIDGIDVYIYIKKLNHLMSMLKEHEEIKDSVLDEVRKYAKGEKCTKNGFEIKTMERRTFSFDFPVYNKVKKELKGLEQQSKSLLSQGKESLSIVDEETGEVTEIKAANLSYSYAVVVSELKE